MRVDVRLSGSNCSLKEHSDKQRKRGLGSLGPLQLGSTCSCSAVSQSSKDWGLPGEGRWGVCARYREENSWKHNIKSCDKGEGAGRGKAARCTRFWHEVEAGRGEEERREGGRKPARIEELQFMAFIAPIGGNVIRNGGEWWSSFFFVAGSDAGIKVVTALRQMNNTN